MHMQSRLLALCLIFLAVALTGASAQSAMIPQSQEALTANSSHVLRGLVRKVEARWDETETTIFTEVTVQRFDSYKSTTPTDETLIIRFPGGEADGLKLWVEHTPRFSVGEDVILFLEDQGNFFSITSWVQGKYTVKNSRILEKDISEDSFVENIRASITAERNKSKEE